jgi:SAM-dependent methyltransferase
VTHDADDQSGRDSEPKPESEAAALARLYDLDLADDPGDIDLYLALARRTDGPVVELAVGSGRVAVPLAEAGYDVTGIDRDKAMLDRASERAGGDGSPTPGRGRLRLVHEDLLASDVTAALRRDGASASGYGLAILALNTIHVFAERGEQRRMVETMARFLRPGGLAVIDAWQPQPEDLVRFDGRLSLEWLREDPETGRQVTKLAAAWYQPAHRLVTLTTLFDEWQPGKSARRWSRTDRLRLASSEELVAAAEAAGLIVEDVASDYDLSPYGTSTDRAIVIARRPD